MTDREDDFNRTAQDSEGRKVQQELERQLRELGDTMSDSFRHGFEGRGEEIGDRVWDVGRAAVNAAGYGHLGGRPGPFRPENRSTRSGPRRPETAPAQRE